ncbi:hypothetical protein SAMN05421540_104181 [Psychroflexus halocasei]|uniref:Uncharacterized protein n=2 Tax=Psychroflexus halocasei TaxID=908615 RepID=A0A1H3ZQV8_9FLAO|nr:hypothetical protein SAMN05421540_104181 [Psychroflexus halocasei]
MLSVFLILSMNLFSCTSNEASNKKIILEKQLPNTSYRIFETKTKTNEDDVEQCAKYVSYKVTEDGFKIRGADIYNLTSLLLNINKKDIIISKNIDTRFFEIEYSGIINDKNNKELLNEFLNKLNLKIEEFVQLESNYELYFADKKLIKKFESKNNKTNVLVNGVQYSFKNISLSILASSLKDIYQKNFSAVENTIQFDAELESEKSLNKNLEYLKRKYGISYKKNKSEVAKFKITKTNH